MRGACLDDLTGLVASICNQPARRSSVCVCMFCSVLSNLMCFQRIGASMIVSQQVILVIAVTRGQDYKEKHKLDSKQISNSPC